MAKLLAYGAAVVSVVLLSLIYVVLVAGDSGTPAGSPSPSTGGSGAPLGTIEISAFDLGFDPATVDVAEPGTYTVHFTNTGATLHDLTFEGQPTPA